MEGSFLSRPWGPAGWALSAHPSSEKRGQALNISALAIPLGWRVEDEGLGLAPGHLKLSPTCSLSYLRSWAGTYPARAFISRTRKRTQKRLPHRLSETLTLSGFAQYLAQKEYSVHGSWHGRDCSFRDHGMLAWKAARGCGLTWDTSRSCECLRIALLADSCQAEMK